MSKEYKCKMTDTPVKIQASESISSCGDKEPFALQVLGVDMDPEFPDKCIIILEHFEEKIPDSYVMVEVDGIKWFRQYKKDADGREYLYACNELFPDIELEGVDWKILGLITQSNIKRKTKSYSYALDNQ